MQVKFTENSEMYRAATVPNASVLMQDMWPKAVGSVKERITRAARELGWSFGRTEDIWRQDARTITGEETVDLLQFEERQARRRALKIERAMADARDTEETTHDLHELVQRLARMEAMLASLAAHVAGAPLDPKGH